MSTKTHTTRPGSTKGWASTWSAEEDDNADKLKSFSTVHEYLRNQLAQATVSKIVIERPAKIAYITIHTKSPYTVIGKKGENIERLCHEVSILMGAPTHISVQEPPKPELLHDKSRKEIYRALQWRLDRSGERLEHLVGVVEEVLGSDDEEDLNALEDFLSQYQKKEELELVKKLRDTSFLLDEPRVHRARLHATFQKAIRDEFQFYNQATLAEKIGGETRAALQRIRRWIERGELFSVEDGKKLIPEFLIDWETKNPHPLVAETISSFPENISGWTIAYWMCQGHELLMGLRPVDIMNESPLDYQRALRSLTNNINL